MMDASQPGTTPLTTLVATDSPVHCLVNTHRRRHLRVFIVNRLAPATVLHPLRRPEYLDMLSMSSTAQFDDAAVWTIR